MSINRIVSSIAVMLFAVSVVEAQSPPQQQQPQPEQQQKQQKEQQPKQQQELKPTGTSGATTVTAGEVAKNPSAYFDRKVTVRAEVEDVIGRQTFLLDEDKLFAWPDVLVVSPRLTGIVPEDEMVTVTGTVRRFVDADVRRDYDWDWWGDVDPDVFITFRNRPVIIADSIRTSAGKELVNPSAMGKKK
jgi:hypothetical protein